MREASFYDKLPDGAVRCGLCRFRCHINDGQRGICSVRENRGGTLYSLVYGLAVADNIDPVEKKPLFHFQPGSTTFSIATVGCNFRCLHCQNFEISQSPAATGRVAGFELAPADIVARALAAGCRSISYTYTEPTIFFEYAYDTAVLAKRAGLANIFVTNGYITPEALAVIRPYLDAANIDLKGFSERFYRDVVHASLKEVLATIIDYQRQGIWVELTTLLIPGLNDDEAELAELARFIVDEVGPETPWHISRFHPLYKLTDRPATAAATLLKAREIGLAAGLRHIYLGNVAGLDGEHTDCAGCGARLISRAGFRITANRAKQGQCPDCRHRLSGVFP